LKNNLKDFFTKLNNCNSSVNDKYQLPENVKFDEYDFDTLDTRGPTGHMRKRFVRTFGWTIPDLKKDIMSENNKSYVTCVDDFVLDLSTTQKDYDTLGISSIIKEYNPTRAFGEGYNHENAELFSCRLANLFNVKTQYVAPYKKNLYICVDFLKGQQQIDDMLEYFNGVLFRTYQQNIDDDSLEEWFHIFDFVVDKYVNAEEKIKEEILYKLKKDFAKQSFFKKYILYDDDFYPWNIGLIHEKEDYTDLCLAPGFDYERAFMNPINMTKCIHDDVDFLVEGYPLILADILKDFNIYTNDNNIDNDKISRIRQIFEQYPMTDIGIEDSIKMVVSNLQSVLDYGFQKLKENNYTIHF